MNTLSIFILTLLHLGSVDSFLTAKVSLRQNAFKLEAEATETLVEPKEAVKIFGRLAEKYIMLDASGGLCCYSACSDCEYRLPGGGYRMADQSAARPKVGALVL